ncbi:unnamed protein product [Heterobilharzia americana]|nr:unnamed protein product [Heterobilharzia americana]
MNAYKTLPVSKIYSSDYTDSFEATKFVEIENSYPVISSTAKCQCTPHETNLLDYFRFLFTQLQCYNSNFNFSNLSQPYSFNYDQNVQNSFTIVDKDEEPLDLSLKTILSMSSQQPKGYLYQSHKGSNDNSPLYCQCSNFSSSTIHPETESSQYSEESLRMPFSPSDYIHTSLTNGTLNNSSSFTSITQKSHSEITGSLVYSLSSTAKNSSRTKELCLPLKPTSNDTMRTKTSNLSKEIRRPYTEAELSAAVKAICFGRLGTRRAASVYGIPRSTLRNKICKLNELKKLEEKRLGGKSIILSEFLLNLIQQTKTV